MIVETVDYVAGISPGIRRFIWGQVYQGINRTFPHVSWSFLNYGYASLDSGAARLPLEERDEPDRDFIQLYHHVVATTALAGKDVLEVSSGRGGGSSFIARYLGPRFVTGLDRSGDAVAFCAKQHDAPNLSYRVGDAESLPFGEESFDVVVNVESSHCYGSVVRFLQEVRRVLRPGGYFFWADFRDRRHLEALDAAFTMADLPPFAKENITANVIASLDRMSARKLEAIRTYAPRPMIPLLKEFAGLPGSTIYRAFERREKLYQHYACRKP
jgi:SAM-dependent methyltransferase